MHHFFIIFICFLHSVQSQSFYKVIGSRTVRPNSEYHLAVSVQSPGEVSTITGSIEGVYRNGTVFSVQDKVQVAPFTSRLIRLPIDNIQEGDYKLIATGQGGVQFNDYFTLDFVDKSYSVFVQTDRAVYEPGTTVLFRAIVLNSQLKPAAEVRDEPLDIVVTDGHGNKVKQWSRISALRGVFTGEINLSNRPALGNWNISVTIRGQTYSKSIQVAEYILPKFIVGIDATPHLTFKQNLLDVRIDTRYDYGAKVRGEATVSVFPTIFSGVIQPIFENPFRKVIKIDGSANVQFDIANELKLSDEYERVIVVDVTVEEALTGRRQNNSIQVHLHKYDYKMDLIKTADYFKPGLPYRAYVKISNHDGTPLKVGPSELTIRYGYSRADEVYVEEKRKLDKNGLVKLEFYTPANVTNTTALRIEAEYEGLKERMSPVPAAVSYTNQFLEVFLDTDRPIVNLDVEVSVNCTEPMRYIDYVILGRGDVQVANTLQIDNNKEYKFHFTATHAMVPVAHLIVSYTRPDGELVADSIDIDIDGILQNFVEIQVNPMETEPGLDVDLTIRAQPNSYVGLMAVDTKVNRLRTGFDLSLRDIAAELKSYDPADGSPYEPVMRDTKYHFAWKPGAANPHSLIYESGADLVTNSHIYRHKPTLEDIYLRPVSYDSSTVKPDRGFGLALHPVTRPPLAGPYAFSRIPRPVWNTPKVHLSSHIAQSWLFANLSAGYEGKTSLRRKVPGDALTAWSVTAFSLDPLHGLGLVTAPKNVNVAKGFQVLISLPHALRVGEVIALPVVVMNNAERDLGAEVTLHNPEQKFEFADFADEFDPNATKRIELYQRKKINAIKRTGTALNFLIRAKQTGSIEIKVTASTSRTQDVVIKNLLVLAEGETEYYTKSLLIDLRTSPNYNGSLNFTIPDNAIPGTVQIGGSVVGDLLGPTIVNLDHLIRLPTGCGEQNLVHLLPNIIILDYLHYTRQNTPAIENEARAMLEKAYQTELSYQRNDRTFSPFGPKDNSTSVWLTAYTTVAFIRAKNYIFVDERLIERGLQYLEDIQQRNGSFFETGSIVYRDLQYSNDKSLALTAFVLLAFIESKNPIYTNNINKGLDYIARYIDEEESTYSISLCSYVLHLSRHTAKQSALNLLDVRAKTRGDRKWWTKNNSERESTAFNSRLRSVDIETTAYALLSFIEAGYLQDALPVLNWLIDQQSSIGGFGSSRDTVAALLAIYKLGTKINQEIDMEIEFQYRKQETNRFRVNKNNAMIIQNIPLNKDARIVNVTAKGRGLAIFRINYQYNMNVTGAWPLFTLDPQVDKNSNNDHLQVSICTAFVSQNLTEYPESNMAVMEVNFPSGFTADIDALPSLEVSENVQRVETANNLNKVILYFNNLTSSQEFCPTVSAFRTHKVANQKMVSVVVYDYYDTSRRARIFYNGRSTTLCDICEDDECDEQCNSLKPNPQVSETKSEPENNGKGTGTMIKHGYAVTVMIAAVLAMFH